MEKCNRLLDTLAVRAHRENMGEGHSPSSASTRNVVTETNTYRYSVNPPLDGGAPRPKDFIQFETTNRLLGKQARDPGRRPILRVWAPMRPVSCDCGVWLQGLVWLQGPTSPYRPPVYTHYRLPPRPGHALSDRGGMWLWDNPLPRISQRVHEGAPPGDGLPWDPFCALVRGRGGLEPIQNLLLWSCRGLTPRQARAGSRITRHSHGLPAMNHHIASQNKTLREQILREMYNWNIGMVHWDRPTPSPCKFPVIKWKVSWTTWHFVTRARTFSVPLYVWPEPMRGVETQAHWALWCPGDRDYFLDRGRAGHSPAVWTAQNLCRGHARRLRDHQII